MLSQEVVNGVYDYIRAYHAVGGLPPTYAVLIRRTGLSLNTIRTSLDKLEAQGKLYRDTTKPVIRLILPERLSKPSVHQLRCDHCQRKLTGGMDTFDRLGVKVCASCYLISINEKGLLGVDEYETSVNEEEAWLRSMGYSTQRKWTDER